MKTTLLVVASLLTFSVFSQNRNLSAIEKVQPRSIESKLDLNIQTQIYPEINNAAFERSSLETTRLDISSSSNIYGIFSGNQRVVSAQPSANMIAFGNRAGGSFGATGNDLRIAYSTDLGNSFTNFIVSPLAGSGYMFRYPSVSIFNPAGNTSTDNMLAVYSGPFTNAGGWVGQYYGSSNLDGTNVNTTFDINEPTVYINHLNVGLVAFPSGHVHVASSRLNGVEGNYTHNGWEVQNGMYNSETNTIDWADEPVKIEPVLLEEGRTDADRMVFSPDGSVGYIVATGIDADPEYNLYGVEWPIVYKTTDHGVTWEKTPAFDFSELSAFNEHLWPLRADFDKVVPKWYNKWASDDNQLNNGATVDKNGNLHLAAFVRSTYSIHPDSLNYVYSEEPKFIFDVFMEGDGTWNAIFVDTIRTKQHVFSTLDLDQRIAMSRTEDGSKVFVTWADTDTRLWGNTFTTNMAPDILTWGFDIDTRLYTDPVNKTAFSDIWGDNFWLHVSDMVLTEADQYHVPVSTTTTGTTDLDPVTHHSVSGITLLEADFININNKYSVLPKDAGILLSVKQNYPNPFNGTTQVDVTLAKTALVSLEVYNIVGQKVYEIPARNLGEGVHSFQINAANLKAGIYTILLKKGCTFV
ncbi:MAG: hypothetical protein FD170_2684 [Bacteroidetes bacterium]|nr:MAG: hypothetical protein FD170_2684 [Bacteroidota bacterium]